MVDKPSSPRLSLRCFLVLILLAFTCSEQESKKSDSIPEIITVNGPIPADSLGTTLIHEHVFLDWSGADNIQPEDWDNSTAFDTILPYLQAMKAKGVQSFLECTPNYLGRNPLLLKQLAKATGLQIITNTGLYGARNNQHLPPFAFQITAEELAAKWIKEFQDGIEATDVYPGFIKIGVEGDAVLSEIHEKLVKAAGLAHLATGLAIVAHTGPDAPAMQEVEILNTLGVAPDAFVWTHAQQGTMEGHIELAKKGAWISLDGLGWVAPQDHQGDSTALFKYVDFLVNLKSNQLLHRTLISHDAGWYTHGKEEQSYKPYTNIFTILFPLLREKGFTDVDFKQLLVVNPKEAYQIRVRRL